MYFDYSLSFAYTFCSTETLFLDNNSLKGSMEPICEGAADGLEFLSADTTVEDCDRNCCDSYCTGADDSCNQPDDTVLKFDYNFISRTTYSFSENFKLANVDVPDN